MPDIAPLEVRVAGVEKELQAWQETARSLEERVSVLERKVYMLEMQRKDKP